MSTTLRTSPLVALLVLSSGCGGYDNPTSAYDPPPSTAIDGLWTSSGRAPAILRVAPTQLLTSGRAFAATTVTTASAGLSTLNSIAFDAAGTMWITSADDSRLLAFSPTAIGSSGPRVASVVISSNNQSLSTPTAAAFDRQHRLWVANFGNGTLVRFDPVQLASSGAPVPAVVVSGLIGPIAIAFDAEGSLWATDIQAHTIVKYSAAQIAASGRPAPSVVLNGVDGSLGEPSGIAFDAAGNLWVANIGTQEIGAFTPAQMAASGSPAPPIKISTNVGTLRVPTGLAFDNDGSLWVLTGDGGLEKFTRAQIAVSNSPAPTVALQLNDHFVFWSIAFWPTPDALPIN